MKVYAVFGVREATLAIFLVRSSVMTVSSLRGALVHGTTEIGGCANTAH